MRTTTTTETTTGTTGTTSTASTASTSTTTTTTSSLSCRYRRNIRLCFLIATSTTTSLLPSQCSSYTTNNDTTRSVSYSGTVACDSTAFGTGRWVRFVSPAGTSIPTTAPSTYTCGSDATGWYNGVYPAIAGSTNTGTVCYNWSGNTCNWSNSIQVTNCLTFYVFFLTNPPACQLRYCVV